MRVLGEVALDEDGVVHGWCWSPDQPAARLTVELLVNQEVVSTLVASRFREDLRTRKFGDGYHGFTVTLTKQLALASRRSVVSAREATSRNCFWQKIFGDIAIPEGFDERLAAARAAIDHLGHSPAFDAPRSGTKTARVTSALAALGTRLLAQAGMALEQPAPRPFALPALAQPGISVILEAGPDVAARLDELRQAAQVLGQARAEVILTDDGADPHGPQLQRQAENLNYLFSPGQSPAERRNLAAAAARGKTLVFLDHARGRLGAALHELHRQAPEKFVISAAIADAANRIAPGLAAGMADIVHTAGFGLTLAMPKALIGHYGGFDRRVDDGAGLDMLDWTLRAAKAGAPVAVWRSPWIPDAPSHRDPNDMEAGRRFAERWVMGSPPLLA
jgi:hypothetical protein